MLSRRLFLILIAAATLPAPAFATSARIDTSFVDGVGAGGFDVVSYATGKPLRGDAKFTADYEGAKWYFGSTENLAAFKAAPEKFAPAYGGYCAFAVSKGATASGDPEVWTMVDGKLYFNLSKPVQNLWQQDIPGNITSANANWPKVLE